MIPNKLVKKSIEDGLVDELKGYERVIPEVKVGNGSRLEFLNPRNWEPAPKEWD